MKTTKHPKKKPLKSLPFDEYMLSLPESDAAAVKSFFSELDAHVCLPRTDAAKLRADFENALCCYAARGVQPIEALSRLSVKNLGGFYVRPPLLWYALDDAAKVYPLSMKHGQMAVFRLSVYLNEPVIPEILQMALTFTIKRFPSFATTLKKGFFWHYLDTSKRRYSIEPEVGLPCRPLEIWGSGSQSFRLIYCENRISAEYFHVLTDGTGGMIFLKTLTAEYLRLLGVAFTPSCGVLDINAAPSCSETANEFSRSKRTEKISGFAGKPAVQMSGSLTRRKPNSVLHFKLDAEKLKAVAHSYNATITAYILALMFIAGKSATDELSGNINIQVPVNMRKFYKSDTLRNFALYCGIKLSIPAISDVRSILGEITKQLDEKSAKPAMDEMMNATQRLVNAIRFVPLAVKAPVASIVYGFLGDRVFSNTLSNLGVVDMPDGIKAHIESMDFVLGTALTNRASCSMVTFRNVATLSIAKTTTDPSFEEKLFYLLEEDGITPIVEGSCPYEN